jgi:hypothetical protein
LGFNHQYLAALIRNLNVFYTLPIWQSGVNILGLMPRAGGKIGANAKRTAAADCCVRRATSSARASFRPRLVPLLIVLKRVLTSLVPLLPQATSECLGGLGVQGRSLPKQIRPLPESAKIKLVALLPRSPVSNELLCPLDFGRLHPRLVEKLLRPKQRLRDGEVLCGYCVPPVLLVHELLLDGSQLFLEQVDMTLPVQALRNVRPSRLQNPLTPRSRLVPSLAAVG